MALNKAVLVNRQLGQIIYVELEIKDKCFEIDATFEAVYKIILG